MSLNLKILQSFLRVKFGLPFNFDVTDKKQPVLVNQSMIYRFTLAINVPLFLEVWKMEAMVSLVVLEGWDFSLQLSLQRRVLHIWDSSPVVEKWHRRGWLSWWDVIARRR